MFPNREFRLAFKGLCAQKEEMEQNKKDSIGQNQNALCTEKSQFSSKTLVFKRRKVVRIEQTQKQCVCCTAERGKANTILPHPARPLYYIIAADEVADDGAADEGAGEAVEVADGCAGDVACAEGADVIFD